MIAELLGVGFGCAGYLSARYAWWRPTVDWSAPRVLMYHMVRSHRPGTRFNKLRVLPEQFEKQISWLVEREFQFIFASQLFTENKLPKRCVCLTFDDGFEDNLLYADPILERYSALATLYLVIDRECGWSSKKKAHHGDEEVQSEPKLSDEQVVAMVASGRWELGGHTITHANLATIDDASAVEEITASQEELASRFNVASETFAYPFGIFESRHAKIVSTAGYQGAVTTEPGIASHPYVNPYQVPRVKISGTEGMLGFQMRMRGGKRGWRK